MYVGTLEEARIFEEVHEKCYKKNESELRLGRRMRLLLAAISQCLEV